MTAPLLTTEIQSPLGPMLAASTPNGICLLEFSSPDRLPAQIAHLCRRFQCEITPGSSSYLDQLHAELQEYFAGRRTAFTVALDLRGTPFQQGVWNMVRQIPYAETRSYQQMAAQLGKPAAARAVGTANGSNPVSILVPCHRLLHKDGGLAGYGGELWRKQWLLAWEKNGLTG
jgi:AraC family transcriptional regulator, regulatory protein of adaptative response / methylated-DNA-[protein]-cysteine methyltransferase